LTTTAFSTVYRKIENQPMRARQLTDRQEILNFLESDRLYAAYAIGDLEPELFANSEWVAAADRGRMCAIALLFKGIDPPALFLMGETLGLAPILRLGLRQRRVYLTCREKHLPAVQAFYNTEAPIPMWRMTCQRSDFRPVSTAGTMALSPRHTDELKRLYLQGGGDAFSPLQLATGVFYGVRERGRLVAAAGTHLISPTYGVAAVGNVFTEAPCRGQGYGTATTSAVVSTLFRRGIRDVMLNVAQANRSAIGLYERLGFRRYCPFFEMLAVRCG
jgi:RimJ/RimL family protein N-acetyltransferase